MIILLNGSYIRFCTEEYIENSIFTNFFVHLERKIIYLFIFY